MGLWAAVKAERLGIETLLLDAATLGSGASGGLLGALMPHMPDRWSDKKQFQFDALIDLESEIAQVESATGLSAGYRRCGRIIPLPKQHLRAIAERHQKDAGQNWKTPDRQFHWHVADAPACGDAWVDHAAGEAGFVLDTLAGRVSPRALTGVLAAFIRTARHVQAVEHCGVISLDPGQGRALLSSGDDVRFDHAIIANGHHAFSMMRDAAGLADGMSLGQPVKGQAALLDAKCDPAMPVVFLNGLYVVPHEDGTVAVGSTSEDDFEDPYATDEKLDLLVSKAKSIVPSLAGAVVIERWAGLRPKAIGRDPMVGSIPGRPGLVALTGGFKVSFGLAHHLADAALAAVCGQTATLPDSFRPAEHIRIAEENFRKS